ncbi:MAG TPA: type II toxin-antitoxin system RelE/ParE family toxin [Solirubrobacteraceae bacterium]|nr:type II toxin-antitoxin system RelE/ParE family toxin [Solirubrobacteraceae bacterium]
MHDDLPGLPPASVKAALRKLRDNPDLGKPLGGALKGCRSIRMEGSENRIVYRQLDTGDRVVLEVLAIEKRRAGKAYDQAEKRIG